MSPSTEETRPKNPRFRKGEKCTFTFLIITFCLILLLCIIYIVHLWVVKHTTDNMLKISRRAQSHLKIKVDKSKHQYIGMLYMNDSMRVVCNTLLLNMRWSLAPGQCTAMRTDPLMVDYLGLWKIQYQIHREYLRSDIKETITHTHFNRGNYENNIGLIEHVDSIKGKYYKAPNNVVLSDNVFSKNTKNMFLLDWNTEEGDKAVAVVNPVKPMNSTTCSSYAAPIVETLREYEFCVTSEEPLFFGPSMEHGALLVMKSQVIGFFSWGDIQGDPFVILNFQYYREWFENIIQ